ncbi:MAG: PP2C family protein-serine/threonine phosphatase, partial [Bacteroidota bacterium]
PLHSVHSSHCVQFPSPRFPLSTYVRDVESFTFQSGDFLVLYTDGILEARNEKGEEYGYERLEKAIRIFCEGSVEEMSQGIVESVKTFAHSDLDDDYTVLIVKFP